MSRVGSEDGETEYRDLFDGNSEIAALIRSRLASVKEIAKSERVIFK